MSAENVPTEGMDSESNSVPELTDALETVAEFPPEPELTTGQKLRAARELRGWTQEHVARLLKLSVHQVEALEEDDWASLPCNTIIRGFVRNYARLLNLDSASLMAALDALKMPKGPELEIPEGTHVSVPHEGAVQRRDFLNVFAGFAVLLTAVLIYFFLPEALWQSAMSVLKSATTSAEVAAPVSPEAKGGAEAMASPSTLVLKDEATAAVQPTPAAPGAQVSGVVGQAVQVKTGTVSTASAPDAKSGGEKVLKMSFSKPSWVEIKDRSGEIIFSQLCEGNTQREFEGRPPLALVIGNATHVTVQYKGKPVDLSKRSKDDVARVTVE
ncbi:MAG: RodZ domain-containing protein [Betaproteobacteria bacterium]